MSSASPTVGRPRILQCNDVLYLIRLVRHRLEWSLDELLVLHLLDTNRFISVHYATIHRELERVGVSLKKHVLIVLAMTVVGFSLLVRL
jgi:hypothetical protein